MSNQTIYAKVNQPRDPGTRVYVDNKKQAEIRFDADPQTQLNSKFDKTGGAISGNVVVTGTLQVSENKVLTEANVGNEPNQIPKVQANGKLAESILPASSLTDVKDFNTYVEASTYYLQNSVQSGDVCSIHDISDTYYGTWIAKTEGSLATITWNNLFDKVLQGDGIFSKATNIENGTESILLQTTDSNKSFKVLSDGRAKVSGAPTEDDDVIRKTELDEVYSTYPFGVQGIEKTDFIDQVSLTTVVTEGELSPYVHTDIVKRIPSGYKYIVTFNEVDYELPCSLYMINEDNGFKSVEYVGNISLFTTDTTGLIDPVQSSINFLIISDRNNDNKLELYTKTAGTYTLKIIKETMNATPAPSKIIYNYEAAPVIFYKPDSSTFCSVVLGDTANRPIDKRGTILIGSGNKVSGDFGVAIGNCSDVQSNGGIVIGRQSKVTASTGAVVGSYSAAEASGALALGVYADAKGVSSVAMGYKSEASGGYSVVAGGYQNKASGQAAISAGYMSESDGMCSISMGYSTLANNAGEFATGMCNNSIKKTDDNKESGDYTLFEVGNGTLTKEGVLTRKNAFEVRENGDILSNDNYNYRNEIKGTQEDLKKLAVISPSVDDTIATEITLKDTSSAVSISPNYYGNSTQYVSPQLISQPYTDITKTTGGITFTVNSDYSITANGTATELAIFRLKVISLKAGTYTLSGSFGGSGTTYQIAGGGFYNQNTSSTYTLESDTDIDFRIYVYTGYTANNLKFYPMLNAGSTALPYEKYTGQISPDNPIDIISSGTLNSTTRKYDFSIKSEGANLIQQPYIDTSHKSYGGITWTVNSDNSITANGTAEEPCNFKLCNFPDIQFIDGNTYFLSGCPSGGGSDAFRIEVYYNNFSGAIRDYGSGDSFVYDKNKIYGLLTCFISKGYTANNLTFYPMLNSGSTALPYTPYSSIISAFSLDDQMRSVGDVRDSLSNSGKLTKRIVYVEFDGTEAWYTDIATENYNRYYTIVAYASKSGRSLSSLCNYLPYMNENQDSEHQRFGGTDIASDFSVWVDKTKYSTMAEWKAQLAQWKAAGKPLYVIYQLATQTEAQLAEELPEIPLQDEQTTLSSDLQIGLTNELITDMKVRGDFKVGGKTFLNYNETNMIYSQADGKYLNEVLDEKQHALTAGNNITINNNIISATGSGTKLYLHTLNYPGPVINIITTSSELITISDNSLLLSGTLVSIAAGEEGMCPIGITRGDAANKYISFYYYSVGSTGASYFNFSNAGSISDTVTEL